MHRPFREYHSLQILENFDSNRGPLDGYLYRYFRANPALGSKDRREISEGVYGVMRWKKLIAARGGSSWGERWDYFSSDAFKNDCEDVALPDHLRLSFPEELWEMLVASHGEAQAAAICRASNTPAPVTIRTNSLKTSRDDLLKLLKEDFSVQPSEQSPWGIRFTQRAALFSHPTFKQGLFEMQDEGSQLLAYLVAVEPGQQVMDFCAGAGGKTLAFAPQMQNRGQIYLHDIRENALQEAKQRLKRAGIQNAQCLIAGSSSLKKLKKRMDWVLVDAPCSGSGTLRRNPDMKERMTAAYVQEQRGLQRKIFEQALSYLKKGGHIVYATCSVLNEENQEQLEHFQRCYGLELVGEPFVSVPTEGGMDGFFAAVLRSPQ